MPSEQFAMIYGAFWVFGWIVIVLIAWQMIIRRKHKRLELIHQERMLAMEKGIPLPELPELSDPNEKGWFKEMWSKQSVNPRWPLGLGAIFVCLGTGISLALFLSGDPYHKQIWPFGLISVFLGIGLFLHYGLTKKRD